METIILAISVGLSTLAIIVALILLRIRLIKDLYHFTLWYEGHLFKMAREGELSAFIRTFKG